MVLAVQPLLTPETCVTTDAGFHSEVNLAQLAIMLVTALIADNDLRRRDERFATQDRHRVAPDPPQDKTRTEDPPAVFQPRDFTYAAAARTCVCPAGKSLYRKGRNLVPNGFVAEHFRGAKRDCAPSALRAQCLRTPDTTVTRQVAFFRGRAADAPVTHTARMKAAIDTPDGRRATGNGSSSASSTTSRISRRADTPPNEWRHDLRARRAARRELANHRSDPVHAL